MPPKYGAPLKICGFQRARFPLASSRNPNSRHEKYCKNKSLPRWPGTRVPPANKRSPKIASARVSSKTNAAIVGRCLFTVGNRGGQSLQNQTSREPMSQLEAAYEGGKPSRKRRLECWQ